MTVLWRGKLLGRGRQFMWMLAKASNSISIRKAEETDVQDCAVSSCGFGAVKLAAEVTNNQGANPAKAPVVVSTADVVLIQAVRCLSNRPVQRSTSSEPLGKASV